MRPNLKRLLLALAVLASLGATVAAYARVLDGELVLDDHRTVSGGPALRAPLEALGAAARGALTGGGRPVTDLSFALGRAALGPGPRGAHALSIALHLGVVLLAFAFSREVLRRAGAPRPGALSAVAAGLLALHPLQTEAVSYLSQRAEVLASGLYLGALLLLLAAERRGPGWRGAALGAGGAALAGLAMAAKPVAATLPAAFLLTSAALPEPGRPRPGLGWRAALLAPLAGLAAVHATAGLAGAAGSAHAGLEVPGLSPAAYLATQARVVPAYLGLLAWPADQCADHDVRASPGLADPAALAGAAAIAAAVALAALAAVRLRRRPGPGPAAGRVAAFGALWYLLLLAPSSSVIPLADLMVEHRVYLAALGPFLAAVVLADRGLERLAPRHGAAAGALLAAAVLGALALATWRRNAVWETRLAFWTDAAAKAPGKARPHLGLGQALAARGELDGALRAYQRARAVVGLNRPYEALILRNVAVAQLRAGRAGEAAAAYRASLELNPLDPEALAGLAIVLARQGQAEEARALATRALGLAAENPQALGVLAALRLEAGDPGGAADLFARAGRAAPESGAPRLGQGLALRAAGRPQEACAALREALRLGLEPAQRAAGERALAGCP